MKPSLRPKFLVFLGILVWSLVIAGSAAAQQPLTIAIPTDPDSFDPHRSVAAATGEIAFNIYEGLVKAGPDGSIQPALSSQWDISDDGLTYTFQLRHAYFHDGSRVTSSDVVFSLNRLRDPDISQRAGEYGVIESVTGLDGAVTIQLQRPHGPFLASLAEVAAAVIPEDAENLAQEPVGTGPYTFVEWRPNQEVRLQRFEDHWADVSPHFSVVSFAIVPDDNAAILSLKSGQIDIIPRLDPSLAHQVLDDRSLQVIPGPMNLVQLMALNNQRPPFDDVRVRQALAKAVDREELIVGAAWGHGTALYSGLSPAMEVYYRVGLEAVHNRDLDAARELLRQAGQERLEFTLDLPAPYQIHVQTGEILAQQLAAIGVRVHLNIIEWGTWLERVYNQRDYEATIVGLAGRLDPHSVLIRYQSDSSRNFFNFNNETYDQLIDDAMQATEDDRVELYQQAQEILAHEAAGIFIMDPEQLAVMRSGLQGWYNYPVYVIDAASLYE